MKCISFHLLDNEFVVFSYTFYVVLKPVLVFSVLNEGHEFRAEAGRGLKQIRSWGW